MYKKFKDWKHTLLGIICMSFIWKSKSKFMFYRSHGINGYKKKKKHLLTWQLTKNRRKENYLMQAYWLHLLQQWYLLSIWSYFVVKQCEGDSIAFNKIQITTK